MKLLPALACALFCASCLTSPPAPRDAAATSARPIDPARAPELFPEGFSGAWVGMSKDVFLAVHRGIEPFLGEDYFLEDCAASSFRIAGYAFAGERLRTIQLTAELSAEDRDALLRETTARLGPPTRTTQGHMRTLTRQQVHGVVLDCTFWERPGTTVVLAWPKERTPPPVVRVSYLLCDPAEAADFGR